MQVPNGSLGSQGGSLAELTGTNGGKAIFTLAVETGKDVSVLLAVLNVVESSDLWCISIRYDVQGLGGLAVIEVETGTPTCVAESMERIGAVKGARSCRMIGAMKLIA